MAQIIEKVVKSAYPPEKTEVLWLDTNDNSLKACISGSWDKLSAKENIEYEIVTVECNVAKLNEAKDTLLLASSKGAQLHINSFDRTKKYDEEILTITNDDYKIKFLAVKGRHYVIHFTIEGNGASFCQEFDAGNKERGIILWSLPIGVYNYGHTTAVDEYIIPEYNYTETPLISTNGESSTIDCNTLGIEYHDRKYPNSTSTYNYSENFIGVLVSKEDWSAIIDSKSIVTSDGTNTQWATSIEKNIEIPFIPIYNEETFILEDTDSIIGHDKNGTLNSAIIRMFYPNNNVINCAEKRTNNSYFVPSVGQLIDIYKSKLEINALNNTLVDLSKLFNYEYWSSDQFDARNIWVCYLDSGDCSSYTKGSLVNVLGLYVFNYLY